MRVEGMALERKAPIATFGKQVRRNPQSDLWDTVMEGTTTDERHCKIGEDSAPSPTASQDNYGVHLSPSAHNEPSTPMLGF